MIPAAAGKNPAAFELRFWLLLLFAALIRVMLLSSDFAYDEIWTLEQYAPLPAAEILTDLSLPNNHPLNTLLVKTAAAVSDAIAVLRLHSCLAGVAAVALLGLAVAPLAGNGAALWSMLLLALSAPAAVYAQQARGYSLQLMFLALFCCGLVRQSRPEKPDGFRYWPEAAVAAGGIGAMLTLSSSALFLLLLAAAGWAIRRRPPERTMAFTLAAGIAAGAVYVWWFRDALAGTARWGTPLPDAAAWLTFFGERLGDFLTPALAVLVLAGAATAFRVTGPLLGAAVLSLVSAFWTCGGGARVYLPLAGIFAAVAGIGADRLLRRLDSRPQLRGTAMLLIIAAAGSGYFIQLKSWRLPEWSTVFDAAAVNPPEVLIVYPATAGFPLAWNTGSQATVDHAVRLNAVKSDALLVFDTPGRINGMDFSGNETAFQVAAAGRPVTAGAATGRLYRLTPLTAAPAPDDGVVAVVPPVVSREQLNALENMLRNTGMDWLRLNPWLRPEFRTVAGIRCGSFWGGRVPDSGAAGLTELMVGRLPVKFYRISD